MHFIPALTPPTEANPEAWWFLFHGDRPMFESCGDAVTVPHGLLPGASGLRSLSGALSDPLFSLAGWACQIVDWERTHRYCGKCGGPTNPPVRGLLDPFGNI